MKTHHKMPYVMQGLVFPLMLGVITIVSALSISAIKLANNESLIVYNSQAFQLVDQGAENGIQLLLKSVSAYPDCFNWQAILQQDKSADFLSKKSSCTKLSAVEKMEIGKEKLSVSTNTQYCGTRIAPGYEVNTFMEHEFQTLAQAEMPKPLSHKMTNIQVWSRLSLSGALEAVGARSIDCE